MTTTQITCWIFIAIWAVFTYQVRQKRWYLAATLGFTMAILAGVSVAVVAALFAAAFGIIG